MIEPVLLRNNSKRTIPKIKSFESWVSLVLNHFEKASQISIEVVTPVQIQELNKTYRNKDKPTNILSFPMDLPEYVNEPLLGDLAICAEIIEIEAKEKNISEDDHWAHLVIHGVLHLLGYDHILDDEAEVMESLEIQLLKKININNPYAN